LPSFSLYIAGKHRPECSDYPFRNMRAVFAAFFLAAIAFFFFFTLGFS
jgi:hypothetical protein